MKDLSLSSLIKVVAATEDPQMRVEKMYEWHFERAMAVARVWLAVSGTTFAALLVAFLDDAARLPAWKVAGPLAFAALAALHGGVLLHRVRKIHNEYVSSLDLVSRLTKTSGLRGVTG
ncbi:MAG: hypothetical protein M3134_07890 [Actinomycetota bacterium]|nr:hypothetical protein [Actinomycetota bacterium]